MQFSLIRALPSLLILAIGLAGCGPVNVRLVPDSDEPPLFRRIDARVGTAYTSAARSAYAWAGPTNRVELGEQSVTRFRQVFGAMFAYTQEIPEWPPWRNGVTGVDGVIELQHAELNVGVGNDLNNPDHVRVEYGLCLYEQTGALIRCWMSSAGQQHQRLPLECFPVLAECIRPMVEAAARQAIARLMVDVEGDPAVKGWVARVAKSREHK